MLEVETGEIVKRRLEHENGEAKAFYAGLAKPALIGIEATGYTQWFERMLAEQGHELWTGDAAEIWARTDGLTCGCNGLSVGRGPQLANLFRLEPKNLANPRGFVACGRL